MAKVSPIQSDFGGGEFGPTLNGRVDVDRYRTALSTCLNYLPTIQGGLMRRSATRYIADVKDSTKVTRLISFEFSVTQAYILEFGDQYIRFYRDNGRIEVASVPVELATPYLEEDLFQLRFVQSADVMYLVHPDYKPRKLTRSSHVDWTLDVIQFIDGPYLLTNPTDTELTPGAFSGAGVTVTASSIVGINNDEGFKVTDIGRSLRMKVGANDWGWAEIVGFTSTTVVTVDIVETLTAASATKFWRLGVWSDTTGYPATNTFHEDRLGFAGAPDFPQRIDLSESGEYESFSPTELDEDVIDSNALNFTFNSKEVNVVRWLLSDEKGLVVGTVGGEWLVRPSSASEALTPLNITAKKSTVYGSANIDAAQVGKAGLFLQRSGRKLREIRFYFDVDGFRAQDLTILANHITESGIVEMANQKEPQPVLWLARNDGVLLGVTYERDVESFKAGWHRHILGGVSDAGGNDARVESVAVIPSPDATREELWVIVQRYIDGSVVRQVEYMTRFFDDEVEQKDAFFVDSGLTFDAPVVITNITQASPAVVSAASHGFSNGDKVLISDVLGMTEVNGSSFLVANQTAGTFEITDLEDVDIDSTEFTAYVSGGEVRKYVTAISGLDHLEGEDVDILGDGAVQPSKTVVSGAIVLDTPATTVHIGLGYNSDGQQLRLDAGAADGTAIGKTRRMHRMGIMLHRSLGLKVGFSFDELTELTFRRTSDLLTRAPALVTGIESHTVDARYDFENQFCFRQDQPLPSMILALMPQMHTQDR